MLLTPALSEYDPPESAEGSIDPLGIVSIAERLAVKMVPGIRERQRHPRFLTMMAVSSSLCGEFEEDTLAKDGVSEPWQVFEWLVVEGLVRGSKKNGDEKRLSGLPGREKVARVIDDKVPLSAKRYLKSPRTFGFHGVYRTLARNIGIETKDRGHLAATGYDLLSDWQDEQGLHGFTGSGEGPGRNVRKQLIKAIRESLEQIAVACKSNWVGWPFFYDHLSIYEAGPKEAAIIKKALLRQDGDAGFRSDTLTALLSGEGQSLWKNECENRSFSERAFHRFLAKHASPDLKVLLSAIDFYEQFCRLVQDAFDDVILRLSRSQQKIQPAELAKLEGVGKAADEIPKLFADVAERLRPLGEAAIFEGTFASLAEPASRLDWLERLLEHHNKVQKGKTAIGKALWFDRFDDGTYMIRTGCDRDTRPRYDDSYVNSYRTNSLWSFAYDLNLVE